MRAVVQRVSEASVTVDGKSVGACGPGLVALVGVASDDSPATAQKLARRLANIRLFADDAGKMNRSLLDEPSRLSILAVSNFTVLADTSSGRRPSFAKAAAFHPGSVLFEHFVEALRAMNLKVATGQFGAAMEVCLVNDGPVTVVLEV